MIPIHVSKSSLFKIHFHIFPKSTHRSSKQHNSFRCSHQNPLWISLLSHARNLFHPSYPPWYSHCNDVGRQIQIVRFPLLSILHPYLSFSLLITKYSLATRFSSTLGCILVSVWVTSLGPIPNKSNIILIYFKFVFMYMQKTKCSWAYGCK